MAMRLARPKLLVDIARIPDLAFVREDGDAVAIGATTRQCVVERDPIVRAKLPLLAKVMPFVGHAPTRARGTVGGSLANGDSAAEIVLVAVTLGATLSLPRRRRHDRDRRVRFLHRADDDGAAAGRLSYLRCAFRSGVSERIGVGFHEVSARQSDFAFVAAAAQIALDDDGRCRRLAAGIGAATPVPMRLDARARRWWARASREARGARRRGRRACKHRAAGRPSRLRRLSPARRLVARRARDHGCARSGASAGRACGLSLRSTEARTRSRSSRAPACSIACATSSGSPAPMPAASTACAAPAPCCSTACRCARA